MNDFDFLKQFAQNLDREEVHEPTESDWNKVVEALSVRDQRKRRRRALLAWAFPVAASTVFVILGTMLMQSRSYADSMQSEIVQLQKEINLWKTTSQVDTFVQHVTLIQHDTIYRTVLITQASDLKFNPENSAGGLMTVDRNTAYPNGQVSQQIKSENNNSLLNSTQTPNTRNGFGTVDSSTTTPVIDVVQHESLINNRDGSMEIGIVGVEDSINNQPGENNAANSKTENRLGNLSNLPGISIPTLKSQFTKRLPDGFDLAVGLPAPEPQRPTLIHRLKPRNAMVDVTGGVLIPRSKDGVPGNNFIFGVNGKMAFGSHLRLVAGFEYGWINFKVKGSELEQNDIPEIAPPSSDDELKYVLLKQPVRDVSIGLNYVFIPEKRLHPYIGMSWVGEQTLEQTLNYEFQNTTNGEESNVYVPRSNNVYFNTNGLKIGLGLEWTFAKQFSMGLEGSYLRRNPPTVPLLSERYGIKASLAYSF